MKKKEIYFYEYYSDAANDWAWYPDLVADGFTVCCDRKSTQAKIDNNDFIILTTDLSSLSMDLIKKGYEIHLKCYNLPMIEIKVGSNDWTTKDLRMAHNILKMYITGFMEREIIDNEYEK